MKPLTPETLAFMHRKAHEWQRQYDSPGAVNDRARLAGLRERLVRRYGDRVWPKRALQAERSAGKQWDEGQSRLFDRFGEANTGGK